MLNKGKIVILCVFVQRSGDGSTSTGSPSGPAWHPCCKAQSRAWRSSTTWTTTPWVSLSCLSDLIQVTWTQWMVDYHILQPNNYRVWKIRKNYKMFWQNSAWHIPYSRLWGYYIEHKYIIFFTIGWLLDKLYSWPQDKITFVTY